MSILPWYNHSSKKLHGLLYLNLTTFNKDIIIHTLQIKKGRIREVNSFPNIIICQLKQARI